MSIVSKLLLIKDLIVLNDGDKKFCSFAKSKWKKNTHGDSDGIIRQIISDSLIIWI